MSFQPLPVHFILFFSGFSGKGLKFFKNWNKSKCIFPHLGKHNSKVLILTFPFMNIQAPHCKPLLEVIYWLAKSHSSRKSKSADFSLG